MASTNVSGAKPVIELWGKLTKDERAELQKLARRMRDSLAKANTAEEAKSQALAVLEQVSKNREQQSENWKSIQAFLAKLMRSAKRHAWDDRTWAQRFLILSIIATLPLSGKAAGLAAFGTAVRIKIPIVGAAAGALLGSSVDLASSTFNRLFGNKHRPARP